MNGIALITAGDPNRLTGGYIYNRHMLDALRDAGLCPEQIVLPEVYSPLTTLSLRSTLQQKQPALVIVDSIALDVVVLLLPWIHQDLGARVLALMHMLPSSLTPARQRPLVRSLEAGLLRTADRTIAVSTYLREQFVAVGAAAEQVTVILPGRDGVPGTSDLPSEDSGESFDSLRTGWCRILCVANWSSSKGIHLIIEAMAKLDAAAYLNLVGETGGGQYARGVHKLIDRYGLSNSLCVRGPLQGEALARHYALADVFVLPSRAEGFGTVYAEALSFGLPVVACNVGPLPWLIEESCGILVPPDDSASLARAMNTLAGDSMLRRQMSLAATERALSLPTWQESGEQFYAVVRELLS